MGHHEAWADFGRIMLSVGLFACVDYALGRVWPWYAENVSLGRNR